MHLFVVFVVLEHLRVTVAASRDHVMDVIAGVLDEFAARRTHGISVITFQVICRRAAAVRYEMNRCFVCRTFRM